MKTILKTAVLFLFCTTLFSQSNCNPIPEVNFPGGRVILSFDGNVHDDDDIVALPYATGLWWAAGLKDRVVQVEYNNHVCLFTGNESDGSGAGSGDDSQNMRTSASGAISRFGYNQNIFYDYETNGSASTNKMASEIEKSTAANPLWIIAGGPMETIWRGLEKATKGHANVTVISHSAWNEDHLHCSSSHNWNSLKSKYQSQGVFFVGNCNGGGCGQAGSLNDQNGGFSSAVSNWTWMQNSSKEYNRWIFGRNPFGSSKFDPSDAGMSYFLITGGPFNGGKKTANHNDARKLMENPCESNGTPAPNSAPTLSITSPGSNASVTVGSTLTVNLEASDSDGFINKHEVYVNGSLVDSDGTNYSPYEMTNISVGSYSIKATVTDNDGATASKTISVTAVNAPSTPPTGNDSPGLSITSPVNGSVVEAGSNVMVKLSADDPDGNITEHKIYVNNILVDEDGSNYSAHEITNISAGTHTIKAVVKDNDGNTTTESATITAEGNAPSSPDPVPTPPAQGTAPSLSFISPVDNQVVSPGSDISVSIKASDPDGNIVKHEVFVNGNLVDTDGSGFTPHMISDIGAGTHSIKATVTDNSGESTSESITITVQSDEAGKTTAPTLVFSSPANYESVASGSDVSISISADDPNGVIVEHKIFVNGNLVDTDGSGFTPHIISDIGAGTHTIKAIVKDNDGETASETITITTTNSSGGNSALTVSILSPAKNQNFAVGSTVSVDLSASAVDGSVVKYEIYVNGELVDTDGSYFTPHVIPNIKAGTYSIKAIVTDDKGATATQTTSFTVGGSTQKQASSSKGAATNEQDVLEAPPVADLDSAELPFLKIARNPVKDDQLRIQQRGNTHMQIMNLSGRVVQEAKLDDETMQLDVSGLSPGIYILRSDTTSTKFIVE